MTLSSTSISHSNEGHSRSSASYPQALTLLLSKSIPSYQEPVTTITKSCLLIYTQLYFSCFHSALTISHLEVLSLSLITHKQTLTGRDRNTERNRQQQRQKEVMLILGVKTVSNSTLQKTMRSHSRIRCMRVDLSVGLQLCLIV